MAKTPAWRGRDDRQLGREGTRGGARKKIQRERTPTDDVDFHIMKKNSEDLKRVDDKTAAVQ